jgi:hypothetical protein
MVALGKVTPEALKTLQDAELDHIILRLAEVTGVLRSGAQRATEVSGWFEIEIAPTGGKRPRR